MTIECLIYDAHSLKEKRGVLKRIMTRSKQRFNISISEVDYHDTWQRTKLAIVTVALQQVSAEVVLQQVQQFVDSFPEIERTITNIEWL